MARARRALPALWKGLADGALAVSHMNLAFNQLGKEDAEGLKAALKSNTTLVELDLGSNNFGAAEVTTMCDGLRANAHLQQLTLSFCAAVGPEGAASLARLLALSSCAITDLRLDGCRLGPEGAAAIAAVLKGDVVRINFPGDRRQLWFGLLIATNHIPIRLLFSSLRGHFSLTGSRSHWRLLQQ